MDQITKVKLVDTGKVKTVSIVDDVQTIRKDYSFNNLPIYSFGKNSEKKNVPRHVLLEYWDAYSEKFEQIFEKTYVDDLVFKSGLTMKKIKGILGDDAPEELIDILFLAFKGELTKGVLIKLIDKKTGVVSGEIKIQNPDGQIPMEFDYIIQDILLKLWEIYKINNPEEREVFYCTSYDIATELQNNYDALGNYAWSGRLKTKIDDSLLKLNKTSYEIVNLYNSKDHAGNIVTNTRINIHIIETLIKMPSKTKSGQKVDVYEICFNKFFIEAVQGEKLHYWEYNTKLLSSIKKGTARRLYELIIVKKDLGKFFFEYEDISWKIPLAAEYPRQNKARMNSYLKELKDLGLISDFEIDHPHKGSFYVYYMKKNNVIDVKPEQICLFSTEVNWEKISYLLSLHKDNESIPAFESLKVDYERANGYKYIKDQDGQYCSPERFVECVEYTLAQKKIKKSFAAYLRTVIVSHYEEDWIRERNAREDKKVSAFKKVDEANKVLKEANILRDKNSGTEFKIIHKQEKDNKVIGFDVEVNNDIITIWEFQFNLYEFIK